jgi:hypothetical protein
VTGTAARPAGLSPTPPSFWSPFLSLGRTEGDQNKDVVPRWFTYAHEDP